MVDLMVRFSETVNLGVLDEDQVSYIDVIESPSSLRIAATAGDRNPLHSTSLGKALLAFLPEDEVAGILENHPLIKMTPKTITQRKHLIEHLASVREQGVAFDLEENVEGVICVAAPIFDQRGRVVAAVSVSGPSIRMESKLTALREAVQSAGMKISRMLGPRSESPLKRGKKGKKAPQAKLDSTSSA
jgi:DNA-binding IclR family transcriptional regulator